MMAKLSWNEIYKKEKSIFTKWGVYSISVTEIFFDILAYYTTPFFLKLKLTPNMVSLLCLVAGLSSAYVIHFGTAESYVAGIFLFGVTILLDYVDGSVARATNNTSFFGRFIDGWIDIVVRHFLYLSFVYVIYQRFGICPLFWVAAVNFLIAPFSYFVFDRYSAYIRWMNEVKNLSEKPYIRKDFFINIASVIEDLRRLSLVFAIFNFYIGMSLFFALNLFLYIYYLNLHLSTAYKTMKVSFN